MARPADHLPPVLQHGFRPFFLLGALWAAVALGLWLAILAGVLALPSALDPIAWHRHEMLFGYLPAIVAGFLLTAIPNWTGRLPVRGPSLAGLVLLWLLGRMAVLVAPGWAALVLDVAFPVTLAAVAAREVAAGGNRRNLPVVGLLGLLAVADLLSHLESLRVDLPEMLGDRLAIAVGAMLVTLIGGRIVPSFTTNWLKARRITPLPAPFGRLDKAVMALTGAALLVWLAMPAGTLAGALLLVAAAGTAVRLARWRGARTTTEPLLLILHVGYGWLAVGLALLGLAVLGLVPRSAGLHAVTTGAFGTMTLAVMTRAALGHTGRALVADGWTVAVYILVSVGALVRLAAALVPGGHLAVLDVAGLAWGGAFLLYAIRYAPLRHAGGAGSGR
jgi:uncharacterized protein involved in response to NO